MKRRALVLVFVVLGWALPLAAATFEVSPHLAVTLPELPAGWVVSREAPPALVAHVAEHVKEEAAEKGKALTDARALELARKRLASEELFLYRTDTGAHGQISFAALEKGEAPPSQKGVALSATYAAGTVGDEGWQVRGEHHGKVSVAGAQAAQRFEIDYSHEGEDGHFTGVVGFAHPYWFWIYATDHGKDPADRAAIDSLIREIVIRSTPN